MPATSYLTVARDGSVELEVRRSRFVGTVARVGDEADARAVVDQLRREHWGARHHVHAYVLGPERLLEQASDDGEPSGTGGPPVLEVLRGRGLSDVVVVVSRFFGGTLLGTGGLARAYADAARSVLAEVGVRERVLQDVCEVVVDVAAVGRLEHDLRSRGARVLGVEYFDRASLRFAIPPVARPVAEEIVAELTGGEASLAVVGQEWVDGGSPS
ncbi:MAG: YigZ family protein [Marmoricola sp.]|nr:YigZ family protein [Marmoricola sp.]